MRTRSPRTAAAVLLLALGACASAPRVDGARAPVRLDDGAVTRIAEVIRLEDRREWDETRLRGAAADAHPEVRRRAALALGRLGRPDGVPLMVHLLADPDTAVAATAAFALGLAGDTTAAPALAARLEALSAVRAPTVAAEAAGALGRLPSRDAAAALRGYLQTAPLPAGRDPVAEDALLAAWRHPRGEAPSPLLRWTEAAHPEVRWRAVYALVRRPDPAAAPRLLALAADPDPRVRGFALRGLVAPLVDSAGVPRSTVLPVLFRAIDDPDLSVSVTAVRSLGSFPDPDVVGRLSTLLAAEPARAVTAAESMARLGTAAAPAAAALEQAAFDARRPLGVRIAGLAALVTVAPASASSVASRLAGDPEWRLRAAAGRALATLGPPASTTVASLVRDPDPRVGAATLLAAVEAAREAPVLLRPLLLESLGAADVQLRTAAATGLARLADAATLPTLLDALERAQRDTLNDAALATLDALGALRERGAPAANAVVRRIARPTDHLVHARALARLGDPVRAAWGEPLPIETGRALTDYEALVRRWIAPALAGEPLPRVRVSTASGEFDLELFAADAPLTVDSFVRLAEAGYFDGQQWPRVVANFVIQGGDPRGDQTGGPGYSIRDEHNRHRYHRGALGMALSGPDTGGSQFFVTHSPQPHLDGGYTVFGAVVQGMDVVDRVEVAETIARIRLLR